MPFWENLRSQMHSTPCPETTTTSGQRIPPPQHTSFCSFLLVLGRTLRLRCTPELLRSVLALLSCTPNAGQPIEFLYLWKPWSNWGEKTYAVVCSASRPLLPHRFSLVG